MQENKTNFPENTWKCSNCGNTIVEIKPPEDLPFLPTEVRLPQRYLLRTGLRLYGHGQALKATEIK
jgi:hypothetical protein